MSFDVEAARRAGLKSAQRTPEQKAESNAKRAATKARNAELAAKQQGQARAFAASKAAPVGAARQPIDEAAVNEIMQAAAGLPDLDELMQESPLRHAGVRHADAIEIKMAAQRLTSTSKKRVQAMSTEPRLQRQQMSQSVLNKAGALGGERPGPSVAALNINALEPGLIVMYTDQFVGRLIPEQNFRAALHTGKLFALCPGCKGEHNVLNADGEEVLDQDGFTIPDLHINACPAKEAVKGIRCPVCADNGRECILWNQPVMVSGRRKFKADPNVIELESLSTLDPVMQLKGKLLEHIAAFHPAEGRLMGLDVDRVLAVFEGRASLAMSQFMANPVVPVAIPHPVGG